MKEYFSSSPSLTLYVAPRRKHVTDILHSFQHQWNLVSFGLLPLNAEREKNDLVAETKILEDVKVYLNSPLKEETKKKKKRTTNYSRVHERRRKNQ
jgi:aconitase A